MERLFGFILLLIFVNGSSETHTNHDNDQEPIFSQPITNVSVSVGREAILSCYVKNLENYKVGWMRVADQTVLSLQTRVVTHNSRYSVHHELENVWRLKINNVRESDRGCYWCQLNTTPLKKQIGCIDVHLPPDILDSDSSSDVTINEGQNATLFCTAVGHPQPRITWRRNDGSSIVLHNQTGGAIRRVDTVSGSILNLYRVDRRQMGAYLCIAANDVPPAVSKRVFVNVQFPPNVTTTNKMFGVFELSNVEVECYVEASPRPVSYWVKEASGKHSYHNDNYKQKMIQQSKKYEISEETISSYKIRMLLTINEFNENDEGVYVCTTSNALGRANSTIRLYEVKLPTTTTTTQATTLRTTVTTTKAPTSTLSPSTSTTSTTTEAPLEYITFTPGFIDHYAGESYLNQPHLNFALSNSPKISLSVITSILYVYQFKWISWS